MIVKQELFTFQLCKIIHKKLCMQQSYLGQLHNPSRQLTHFSSTANYKLTPTDLTTKNKSGRKGILWLTLWSASLRWKHLIMKNEPEFLLQTRHDNPLQKTCNKLDSTQGNNSVEPYSLLHIKEAFMQGRIYFCNCCLYF